MGRQRMISDSFWVDPDLKDHTAENRITQMLFLTSPDSNVIGVYRTMWRLIGAGMGWTEPQLLNAARDLVSKGVIAIDEPTGWVWVKEWWKHNSLRGAFLGNVARKARAELSQVPPQWKDAILEWIASYDEDGICTPLLSPLEGASKGLASPSQEAGGNPNHKPNISTTTNQNGGANGAADIDALISAAVWVTSKTGVVRNEVGFRHKVRSRILENGPSAEDLRALDAWKTDQATASERALVARNAIAEDLRRAQRIEKENVQAEAALAALNTLQQERLIQEFGEHLGSTNDSLSKLFKKQGMKSKLVRVALLNFMKDNTISQHEPEPMES